LNWSRAAAAQAAPAIPYTACSARLYVGEDRQTTIAGVRSIRYLTAPGRQIAWEPVPASRFVADAPLLSDGRAEDTSTGYRIPEATTSSLGTLYALIDLGRPKTVTKGTFSVSAPAIGPLGLCLLWSSSDGKHWTRRSASPFNQTGTGNMGFASASARYWQFLFGTPVNWPHKMASL
jgi:hypothetical protein